MVKRSSWSPDYDPMNADWTKRTWDLPEDPREVARTLHAGGLTSLTVGDLPLFKFHPQRLPAVLEALREIERVAAEESGEGMRRPDPHS